MPPDINKFYKRHSILQLNISGMINPTNMSQRQKCKKLFKIIKDNNVEIVLLQEWSATLRYKFETNDTYYTDNHGTS